MCSQCRTYINLLCSMFYLLCLLLLALQSASLLILPVCPFKRTFRCKQAGLSLILHTISALVHSTRLALPLAHCKGQRGNCKAIFKSDHELKKQVCGTQYASTSSLLKKNAMGWQREEAIVRAPNLEMLFELKRTEARFRADVT